ncbi:hypothetical protein SCUCBS95973_008397 [Sporothrix curviconia]|uniref:FAD dependent oxidoreductase domain-containing protein n=1 Tax=Sporothrix curviconia TaxID=1260050 RepID=A0ABP0CP47_9PEZI
MSSKPSVVIVGGGVFGTSTAYHLISRGYSAVTVLDRFDAPSKDSAGADLNKVIRTDYPNPLYAKLASEAMAEWKDPQHPIFGNMFRPSGWIMGGHEASIPWLQGAYETAKKNGRNDVDFLTPADIRKRWPATTGPFDDWTSIFSGEAGWVPSGQALLRMANAARAKGARYLSGDAGHVKKIVYDNKTGACTGAVTADGTVHHADLVIVASGANTPRLLPEARLEVEAQCSVICVMQLTDEETAKFANIPIIEDFEAGIMFPPDENNLLKLCSCRTITNYQSTTAPGMSVLHSLGDYPYDGCPAEIEKEMRAFVADIAPELADRAFVSTKMCWDAIAKDLNFRICPFPEARNLYVATMGSNHGFKFLPVIGKYVVDMIEGSLDADLLDLWRWKNGKMPEFKDPHPFPVRDLSTLTGWQNRHAPNIKLPWAWSRL